MILDVARKSKTPTATLFFVGHLSHSNTSWSSFKSIFTFLKERYDMSETEGKKDIEVKESAPKDEKTEL